MKRNLLAVATAGITAGLATQAHAGFPTLYGKLNVSVQSYDFESINFPNDPASTTRPPAKLATGGTPAADTDQWALESSGSRLGVRGDHDVNNDTKILYTLEYGTDADEGNAGASGTFSQRNIFTGLQNVDLGTLVAGRIDTPLKILLANPVVRQDIDRFNDLALADAGYYLAGEERPSNTVLYTSPIFAGGFEARLAAVQIEESGIESTSGTTTVKNDDNGLASGSSASVTYGKGRFFVGVSADRNIASVDARRAVGEVTLGKVKLGALVQTAEVHETIDSLRPTTYTVGRVTSPISEWDGATADNQFKEQKGYVLNASWKTPSPWTLKAQVGSSDTTPKNAALADVEASAIALGADYKLNDFARLFSYYAQIETEGDAKISADATTDRTAGVGIDVLF